jgi:hypothetical protein
MPNDSTAPGYLTPTSPALADDAALDAIFQTLVAGVSGLDGSLVRPRWQPVPPKQPDFSVNWCALGVVSVKADANPAIIHNGADDEDLGSDTLYRHALVEVLLSFYGPQGQQYAEQTRDGLWVLQNYTTLAPALMVFTGEAGEVRGVPELINQQWQRRYDFTAWFGRQIVRTYGVRNFASATALLTEG